MDKRDYIKRMSAGIFFIIGILLILTIIWVIGIEKGFTQPKFQVTVLFKRVDGLGLGAPIRFSGVDVGTISGIDFLDEKVNGRGVKITLNIFKRCRKQLERSTKFSIRTEGVLGGKLIEITSDEHGPYVDLSLPIMGEDPLDVEDVLGVFTETARSFTETSKAMDSMLDEVKSISKSSRRLINRLEQKIIEGSLFKVF